MNSPWRQILSLALLSLGLITACQDKSISAQSFALSHADPQTKMYAVEGWQGGRLIDFPLLITSGLGYRLDCPDDPGGMSILIEGLGFNSSVLSLSSYKRSPDESEVTESLYPYQPVLKCNDKTTKLFVYRTAEAVAYYLSFPTHPGKLYAVGCFGLLEGLGKSLDQAAAITKATVDNNQLLEINCRRGEKIEDAVPAFLEIDGINQTIEPGQSITPIELKAETSDHIPIIFQKTSTACDWLYLQGHRVLGTAALNIEEVTCTETFVAMANEKVSAPLTIEIKVVKPPPSCAQRDGKDLQRHSREVSLVE